MNRMIRRATFLKFLLCILLGVSGQTGAAVISPGTQTFTVPSYLAAGSYLFPCG